MLCFGSNIFSVCFLILPVLGFVDSWLQVPTCLLPRVTRVYSSPSCLLLITYLLVTKQEALKRILFIFAKLNPGIRYVQGMNEVLAPLYYVFKTDVDEANAVRTVSLHENISH